MKRSIPRFVVPVGFGLLLTTACWGLAAWAAYTAVRWTEARSWPAVPCIITRSATEEDPRDHRYLFRVAYRYTWVGESREGRIYQEDYGGSYDIAEADRLTRAFPVGSHRACYVNPAKLTRSQLEHDNPWVTASIAIVLLLGGSIFVLPGRAARMIMGSFLALMGLAGCAVFALPLSRGLRSHGWRGTPCVIRSGQVVSIDEQWHARHWADIVYGYEVDGVSYRANTINASDMSSPWFYGARGTVRRFPRGMVANCYVNPADPSEAALDRSLSGTQWFGVWPLVMTIMGASYIFAQATGRDLKLGTPRLWGTLALGAATTSALTALWITGADLLRDYHSGLTEWQEWLAVIVAGGASAGLLFAWVSLAAHPRGLVAREESVASPSVVFDHEIDQLPGREGERGWRAKSNRRSG